MLLLPYFEVGFSVLVQFLFAILRIFLGGTDMTNVLLP